MIDVVQVPEILFSRQGTRGRKIYIECFTPLEKANAQKDAKILSEIMKERIFSKTAGKSPIIRPVNVG